LFFLLCDTHRDSHRCCFVWGGWKVNPFRMDCSFNTQENFISVVIFIGCGYPTKR
jgi:hypothetical protein